MCSTFDLCTTKSKALQYLRGQIYAPSLRNGCLYNIVRIIASLSKKSDVWKILTYAHVLEVSQGCLMPYQCAGVFKGPL